MSGLDLGREVRRGVFFSLGATAVFRGGELAARIFLARIFSAAAFGEIVFGLALLYLGVSILLLGMEQGVLRFVAFYDSKDDAQGWIATFLASGLVVAVLGGMVAGAILSNAEWLARSVGRSKVELATIRALALALVPVGIGILVRALLTGLRLTHLVVIVSVVEKTLVLAGLAAIAVRDIRIAWLVFAVYGVGAGWSAGLGVLLVRRRITQVGVKFRVLLNHAGALVRYSWRIAIGSLLNPVRLHGELLLLGLFLSASGVGAYGAASILAGAMLLPVHGVENIMTAIFSQQVALGRRSEVGVQYRRMARWLFLLGVSLLSVVLLDARQLLEAVFGPEYGSAGLILVVMAAASLMNLASGTQGAVNCAFGHTGVLLASASLGVSLHLVLGVMLVTKFGAIGMAFARVASVAVSEGFGVITIYRRHGIQPLQKEHMLIAGIGLVVIFALLAVRSWFLVPWWVESPICATSIVGASVWWRFVSVPDLGMLKRRPV